MKRSNNFDLGDREVLLSTVQLEGSELDLALCQSWLSQQETDRAARFRFDEHRREFVLSHGVLRALLGGFIKTYPKEVALAYGSKGKPFLAKENCALEFNMSHSGNLALYAFTFGCPIGVDLERIRPFPGVAGLAAAFFAPEEAAELSGLSELERTRAFFRCWTRKEAYIKATGDGLSTPLDEFRVSLLPDEPAQVISVKGDAAMENGWTLHHLTPTAHSVAAVAYRDRPRDLVIEPLASAAEVISTARALTQTLLTG